MVTLKGNNRSSAYDYAELNSQRGETMFFISRPRLLIFLVGLFCIISAFPTLGEPPMQSSPTDDLSFTVLFSGEEVPTEVTDLVRNPVGEGIHTGAVKCKNGHCNKKTQLDLDLGGSTTDFVTLEYKFHALQAVDVEARRAVVSGSGTITSPGQKERFSFYATFQDNGDGTVNVRYDASRPDASFIIPGSPGSVEIAGSS